MITADSARAALYSLAKLAGVFMLMSLSSCGTLSPMQEPIDREVDVSAAGEFRAAQANQGLDRLVTSDVHVRFASEMFAEQMRQALQEAAGYPDALSIRDVRVTFGHQLISLSAQLDWQIAEGTPSVIGLAGEIDLAFSGNQLVWIPRFIQAEFLIRDAAHDSVGSQVSLSEIVQEANSSIIEPLVIAGGNTIALDYFPFFQMHVGARMGDSTQASVSGHQDLAGFFGLAGQSLLVGPRFTSAILDLELLPNFSRCTSGLSISRSTFAGRIRQREPAEIALWAGDAAGELHFFTEVRGASRSTSIVHYWFADGQPVGLEELVVEPSDRWRTWSTRPSTHPTARLWEVVVVERDSGCVLQARTLSSVSQDETQEEVAAPGTFRDYKARFEERLEGFEGLQAQAAPALVETRSAWFSDVATSLLGRAEIELPVDFAGPERLLAATLQPFRSDGQVCQKRECSSNRVCRVAVSRCIRRQDSRDCSVCSFRNPLNNRCMSKVEDPVCVTSKAARNREYEDEREVCLAREERARVDCERLRDQEIQSCEMESRSAESVCTANLEALEHMQPQMPIASVEGRVAVTGSIVGRFVDFELGPDLSTLRMTVEFSPDATYTGEWSMQPTQQGLALSDCLSGWRGRFESRLVMPAPRLALIGTPAQKRTEWLTSWSGFVIPASITPSPLESVFGERPDFLAACGIALTVDGFREALRGEDAELLGGSAEWEIQPLTSRLVFGPATLRVGESEYAAEVRMTSNRMQVSAIPAVSER